MGYFKCFLVRVYVLTVSRAHPYEVVAYEVYKMENF